MPGRLVPRLAFQVTQYERRPVFVGKTLDFLIEEHAQLTPGGLHPRIINAARERLPLQEFTPGDPVSEAEGNAVGDTVQPTGQRIRFANSGRLADEDEERGLERVIDIGRLPQQALANAAHHRPVLLHESGKSILVALRDEFREQHAIALLAVLLIAGHAANVSHKCLHGLIRHWLRLRQLMYSVARTARTASFFAIREAPVATCATKPAPVRLGLRK